MSVVDEAAVQEYNAFGPWVTAVTGPWDVPPLFASHRIDFDAARLILKFPRPESRRDLLAGMNLYDYLVVVTPASITVLKRHGDQVADGTFALDQLATISSGADLLDGHLLMTFVDGSSYSIPYNGSASVTMARLVDTVRGMIGSARRPSLVGRAAGPRMPLSMDALGREDVGLANAANEVFSAENDFDVLSAAGRRIVTPRPGLLGDLRHRFAPTTLHGSVIAVTTKELVILSRVRWLSTGSAPDLSMRRTVIRLDRVTEITAEPHSQHPEVTAVAVISDQSRFELFVGSDSAVITALVQHN